MFLFSAHVDLEAEVALKNMAAQQGLMMMGPDCGTAILNGIPLGFANHLPRGAVGLMLLLVLGCNRRVAYWRNRGWACLRHLGWADVMSTNASVATACALLYRLSRKIPIRAYWC